MKIESCHIEELLKEVIDPELGVNIVDLGLVYSAEVDNRSQVVEVNYTLTSPTCPLGAVIRDEIEYTLRMHLPNYHREVNLVWKPIWDVQKIKPEGKLQLQNAR